jgi:hypothetical protein
MPPLGQYFWGLPSQPSPLLPPKGTDPRPLRPFSLQTSRFRGSSEGAMIAISDPWARRRSYLVEGEGHAPVVAVLRGQRRTRPDESIQRHGPPDSCGFFPAKGALPGDRRRGP